MERVPQGARPPLATPPPRAKAEDSPSERSRVAAQPVTNYQGPPPGIDGPQLIAPPPGRPVTEEILPGTSNLSESELFLPEEGLEEIVIEDNPFGLPGGKLASYRNGFFQKLALSASWFGNSNDPDDLGGTEIEGYLTVALPFPIVEWPLLITPGINTTFIDGPTVTDLPSRLYHTYVDFMWLPKIVNHWTLLLSVAPTVYGDFDANEFRLTGKALAIYDFIPERVQLIAGVLYLNRENIMLLPAGGVIWMPADWTRLELIFPKPKIAVRINQGQGYEDWIYTTAEFGGNTWPIIRDNGTRDEVTYTDYRILSGFERKLNGGTGYRLEAGYVFGRSIRFESASGDFDPQDTFLVRGGITF